MGQFSYSFVSSLLHSIWQSAVLLLIYIIINAVFTKQLPGIKRNALYFLLIAQVIISCLTFFICYTGTAYPGGIAQISFNAIIRHTFLERFTPWLITAYTFGVAFKTAGLIYNWYHLKIDLVKTWIRPGVDLRLFTSIKAHE